MTYQFMSINLDSVFDVYLHSNPFEEYEKLKSQVLNYRRPDMDFIESLRAKKEDTK